MVRYAEYIAARARGNATPALLTNRRWRDNGDIIGWNNAEWAEEPAEVAARSRGGGGARPASARARPDSPMSAGLATCHSPRSAKSSPRVTVGPRPDLPSPPAPTPPDRPPRPLSLSPSRGSAFGDFLGPAGGSSSRLRKVRLGPSANSFGARRLPRPPTPSLPAQHEHIYHQTDRTPLRHTPRLAQAAQVRYTPSHIALPVD